MRSNSKDIEAIHKTIFECIGMGLPTNINREKFERSRLLTIERRLRTPFSSSGVPPPFHPAFPIQLCRRQKSVKTDRRDNKKKKTCIKPVVVLATAHGRPLCPRKNPTLLLLIVCTRTDK